MPTIIFAKVTGGPETAQALLALGRAGSAEKALRDALRPGARLIANTAKAIVPVDTGALRRSISVGTGKVGTRYVGRLVVGQVGPRRRVAHLVEFGTRKMRAQPFMRPAMAQSQETVVHLFGRDIGNKILAEAARRARVVSRKLGG